ncbi:MAG: hypothetical protein ACHQ5A_03860, partial [Opitutales bacterium]
MLKETPRSVRAYFALVAILWFIAALAGFRLAGGKPLLLLLAGLSLLLCVLYAYVVTRFMDLLKNHSGFIKNVLTVGLVYS